MSDYSKSDIGSGYNTSSAINTELGKIETAVNSKVDKSGSTMTGDLDMNSQRILNLPPAGTASEPVTYGQFLGGGLNTAVGSFRDYPTMLSAIADIDNISVGDTIFLQERVGGEGGSSFWKAVDATTVVENEFDIVTGNTTVSLQIVDVLPLDVRSYGITQSISDCQVGTQRIADRGIPSVRFTGVGSYSYLSTVTFSSDIIIEFDEGAVIDGSNAGFTGSEVFLFEGSTSTLPNLNADVTKGESSLTFASSHGLVAEDIFIISNPTNSSWSGFRTDYKAGEYCEVASVSGNTVQLKNPLYDSYVVANVGLVKQNSVKAKLVNPQFSEATSLNQITFNYCRGVRVERPYMRHNDNACIRLRNCYDSDISVPDISNIGDGGDDYGVLWTNCQHGRINGGQIYARRHSVTIGGGTGTEIVPCRDIRSSATLKNDPSSGVFNADFHGHAEDCQYHDCIIYGGATWQGKNNGYDNCTIYNYEGEDVNIRGSEILGGRHYARNCDLINYGDPSGSGRGIVDVGGNSVAIGSNTTEDCLFELKGCTLNAQALSNISSVMSVRNRGTTAKLNVVIDGLDFDANDFGQILNMNVVSGTADSDYIIVDNIRTNLTGKRLANLDSNYLAFPLRLQSESGREQLTTDTGQSLLTFSTVTFNWEYPKKPTVTSSISERNRISGVWPVLSIDPLSTTQLTPILGTADGTNFGSAVTIVANWQVGINEA